MMYGVGRTDSIGLLLQVHELAQAGAPAPAPRTIPARRDVWNLPLAGRRLAHRAESDEQQHVLGTREGYEVLANEIVERTILTRPCRRRERREGAQLVLEVAGR